MYKCMCVFEKHLLKHTHTHTQVLQYIYHYHTNGQKSGWSFSAKISLTQFYYWPNFDLQFLANVLILRINVIYFILSNLSRGKYFLKICASLKQIPTDILLALLYSLFVSIKIYQRESEIHKRQCNFLVAITKHLLYPILTKF